MEEKKVNKFDLPCPVCGRTMWEKTVEHSKEEAIKLNIAKKALYYLFCTYCGTSLNGRKAGQRPIEDALKKEIKELRATIEELKKNQIKGYCEKCGIDINACDCSGPDGKPLIYCSSFKQQ